MVRNTMPAPNPWAGITRYRYEYSNAHGMYRVYAVDQVESWITEQDQSLWTYDEDDNPSYWRAVFLLEPKLLTLLRLMWDPNDCSG